MIYDLHVHSSCSDGKLEKITLIKEANHKGLSHFSITDHNYIENKSDIDLNNEYEKRFGEQQKVKIISGIEFDIYDFPRMHILGYNFQNVNLIEKTLDLINQKNDLICNKIINNIFKIFSININREAVLELSKEKYLSKKGINKWMVYNGYSTSMSESSKKFTSKKSLSYEKKVSLTIDETLKLIKEAGGISILAHPSTLQLSDDKLEELIMKMILIGLDGIEINNTSKTTENQYILYKKLAEKYSLLTTCGTDFHNYENYPGIGIDNEESNNFLKRIR